MAEIQAMGRKAAVFKADFDRVDEVLQLAEQAIGFLGQVDCLINNAGITFNRPFGRVTLEQFDRLYHVNVRAQFFLTQRIADDMLKHGGGAVVNVTSIHGVSGAPEHSVYAGSKGAIIAYTRTLAVELAHKGIRVNAIAPGCIPVENYEKFSKATIRSPPRNGPTTRFPWAMRERRSISAGLRRSSSAAKTPSSSSGKRSSSMAARRR